MEQVIDVLLLLLLIYGCVGVAFGIFFIFKGAQKLDPEVKNSPWHFRLMILPGSILLWSYLLIKMIRNE